MRIHIALPDKVVADRAGLDDEQRWDEIEAALGTLDDHGHAWDDDPAAWVRAQRRSDSSRSG